MATASSSRPSPAVFNLPLDVWNAILGHIEATLPARDRRALAQAHAAFARYLRPALLRCTTVFPTHDASPLLPATAWFRSNPQYRPLVRELVILPRSSSDRRISTSTHPIPAKDILSLCALLPQLQHLRIADVEIDSEGLPTSLPPTGRPDVARLTLDFSDSFELKQALVGVAPHLGSLAELAIDGNADFSWGEAFTLHDALTPYSLTPHRFSITRCGLFKCTSSTVLMNAMASTLTHVHIQLWPIAEGHYEMFGYDHVNIADLEALVDLSIEIPLTISGWYPGEAHASPLAGVLANTPPSLESVTVVLRRCRLHPTSFAAEVASFPIEVFRSMAVAGLCNWTLTFSVVTEDLDGMSLEQFWNAVRAARSEWADVAFTSPQYVAVIA